MNSLMVVSQIGLWIIVSFLLLTILALTRQIGLLHQRITPTGARTTTEGPAIGEPAPAFETTDLSGRPLALANRVKLTLMVFIATDCSVCEQLLPSLRSLRRTERKHLDILFFSLTSDETKNREFVERHKLSDFPFIASAQVVRDYNVLMPPYAVLVGADGLVKAKGMTNHMEHLESLLTAARIGYPTLEAYVKGHREQRKAHNTPPALATPEQAANA